MDNKKRDEVIMEGGGSKRGKCSLEIVTISGETPALYKRSYHKKTGVKGGNGLGGDVTRQETWDLLLDAKTRNKGTGGHKNARHIFADQAR